MPTAQSVRIHGPQIPSTTRLVCLCLLLSGLNGCDDSFFGGKSATAVVDAVSVARALGRDEAIQTKLNEATDLLNSQLSQISSNLQKQLRDEQQKLGSGDQKKLENLTVQSQIKLRQTQMLAKQKASDFRTNLLIEFRNEVKTVAIQIAEARGFSTVMLASSNLLWYSPGVDITADVIKKLRATADRPPAQTEKKPTVRDEKPQYPPADREQVKALNQLMENIEKESPTETESGKETGKKP